MPNEKDPMEEYLNPGLELFPAVDLEAGIMVAVREEAALRQKARRMRRRGLLCLTVFLLLLALALWNTSNGYSNSVYRSPLVSLSLAALFVFILFAQLEAWGYRRSPSV